MCNLDKREQHVLSPNTPTHQARRQRKYVKKSRKKYRHCLAPLRNKNKQGYFLRFEQADQIIPSLGGGEAERVRWLLSQSVGTEEEENDVQLCVHERKVLNKII